jgi:hypothetical protein
MNMAAWQPSKTGPKRQYLISRRKQMTDREVASLEIALQGISDLGVADTSERLIVIAVAVALRGGDVTIFAVVVGGCRRQFF